MSDNQNLTKGSIGEYHAIFKLLEKGYNVYKNVECNGQIDIILESRETKKLLRIDIKTAKAKLRKNQLNYPDDGILRLVIDNDGIMYIQNYAGGLNNHQDYIKITKKYRFHVCMYRLGMTLEKPVFNPEKTIDLLQ